jgi:hypothetical protein
MQNYDDLPEPTIQTSTKESRIRNIKKWKTIASEELRKQRTDICKGCDKYEVSEQGPLLKKLSRCTECGCFLKPKIALEGQECPIGKW